jgi:acetyl-CoA acetyltransferase
VRDVAVVSYAASAVAKETKHNEVEIITPVIHDAVKSSGIPAKEIGFTCSGSLDYLFGGPFAFVQGIDAVGAWPPIRESHVEMDAAWALYEAWIAIQTGEVDSALIYGFSKGSLGDVAEIMAMQHDPYYLVPLWPSMFDLAAMHARCYLEESGHTERDLAEVAARAQRNGRSNPHAVRKGDVSADDLLAQPVRHDPLRESDIFPTSDGATAVVIAASEVARKVCERPAWIRGIEHRIEAHSIGVRDLASSPSTRAAGEAAGVANGAVDVAELHAQFSHEELILRDALGLSDSTVVNPSGGPLAANTIMAAGLSRIGEVAVRIHSGEAGRGVAHATSGPCLQQNLVCVMEAE